MKEMEEKVGSGEEKWRQEQQCGLWYK